MEQTEQPVQPAKPEEHRGFKILGMFVATRWIIRTIIGLIALVIFLIVFVFGMSLMGSDMTKFVSPE